MNGNIQVSRIVAGLCVFSFHTEICFFSMEGAETRNCSFESIEGDYTL
ncbi:hypothetical protein VIBC2010_20280 [Vibrio caribbeanicus ATCC BAA-2122]|uniref:Uncharacterized protein n=1 Tax=Vibrio caribbeanicus ATCC BAA-2122 TaxID=796620 RepID=E3BJ64_9VIBR|nr:hypothetical protein VIBC2010_20280 [Vibrio caribbeanicus ATCC BAA-2122]